MTVHYHRVAVELRRAPSVVICGHVSPDGDAVGAVLGLTLALRDMGVPAVPTLADDSPAPQIYMFLPGFALFQPAADLEPPAIFVALDTPTPSRLGTAEQLSKEAGKVIVIDHHPDNRAFGEVNLLDPGAASTSQIVWRLLHRLEVDPTPEIALCLYVGLVTDTGRFQYSNTDPAALRDAADMLDAGADPTEAARWIYENRSHECMSLDSRVLSRLTIENHGRVAYAWLSDEDFAETGARPDETEHLVDAVRVVGGVDVVALFRVRQGEVRANLRAKTGFDVGGVARAFGGGGHAAASGFTYEGDLATLLSEILPKLPS